MTVSSPSSGETVIGHNGEPVRRCLQVEVFPRIDAVELDPIPGTSTQAA